MAGSQADMDAIEAQAKKGLAAYNAQDAKAVASFFTEDCRGLVPGCPPAIGREAAIPVIEAFFKSGIKSMEITTDELIPMGEYYLKRGVASGFDAEKKPKDKFNYVQIWRKDNGEWLHFYQMLNSQTPPKTQ